jgi:hypothetical protein
LAIMMQMAWHGVSSEDYDALRKRVNWEGDPPIGGIFHVAAFHEGDLRITDVWNSAEEFDAFVKDRLMPGVTELGIAGEPKIEILPAHAVFSPA